MDSELLAKKKESEHYQLGASQAQARISASMAETHKEDEKESFIGSKKPLLSTKIALLLDVKTTIISSGWVSAVQHDSFISF